MGQKRVWPHLLWGNQVTEMRDCLAPVVHPFQSDASWPSKASVIRTRSSSTPSPAFNVMIALLETPFLSGLLRLIEPLSAQIRGTKTIWKISPWRWVLGQLWLRPLPSCKILNNKAQSEVSVNQCLWLFIYDVSSNVFISWLSWIQNTLLSLA